MADILAGPGLCLGQIPEVFAVACRGKRSESEAEGEATDEVSAQAAAEACLVILSKDRELQAVAVCVAEDVIR